MGELYLYSQDKEYLESAELPRGYILALQVDTEDDNLYQMCFLEGENKVGELDTLVEELSGCRVPIAFLPEGTPEDIEDYAISQYDHIIEKRDNKLKYLQKREDGVFDEKIILERTLSEIDRLIFEASFFGMMEFSDYVHIKNDGPIHTSK
jgi:hypothetical protein